MRKEERDVCPVCDEPLEKLMERRRGLHRDCLKKADTERVEK